MSRWRSVMPTAALPTTPLYCGRPSARGLAQGRQGRAGAHRPHETAVPRRRHAAAGSGYGKGTASLRRRQDLARGPARWRSPSRARLTTRRLPRQHRPFPPRSCCNATRAAKDRMAALRKDIGALLPAPALGRYAALDCCKRPASIPCSVRLRLFARPSVRKNWPAAPTFPANFAGRWSFILPCPTTTPKARLPTTPCWPRPAFRPKISATKMPPGPCWIVSSRTIPPGT